MAQAFNNVFGTMTEIKGCDTPQELWDFVKQELARHDVDYVKVTRDGVKGEMTEAGKEADREKAYRDKY